jgi:hypothetical protein
LCFCDCGCMFQQGLTSCTPIFNGRLIGSFGTGRGAVRGVGSCVSKHAHDHQADAYPRSGTPRDKGSGLHRYIAPFGQDQVKNQTKCAQHLVHTQPLTQCARIPTPTNVTQLERFGPLSRPTACVFKSRSRSSTGPHTTAEPADFTASPELVRLHSEPHFTAVHAANAIMETS